jgi:hypothetical protein
VICLVRIADIRGDLSEDLRWTYASQTPVLALKSKAEAAPEKVKILEAKLAESAGPASSMGYGEIYAFFQYPCSRARSYSDWQEL